ncbi:MAG: hypothetical protein LBO75_01115 [Bifidobacteriaceae bacterium]|jgi:hypothetical protein|nr:hypothetical protein [Bifidobacteriaceae bacterium]
MKLKKGLRVLWRSHQEAQVGNDPRVAHTIKLEHPREFDILQLLESDQTPSHLRQILAELGGRRDRVNELIRELAEAGLLIAGSRARPGELQVHSAVRELLAPEAESRGLVENNAWAQLARRGLQRVSIYGLGRTGAHIALGLAAAGIGHLHLRDPQQVVPRDRGQIFGPCHVGLSREEALAQIIKNQGFECDVRTGERFTKPHAAVLVDYEVTSPNLSDALCKRGVSHLSVVVNELSISCGPWVQYEYGPCLRCQRLWTAGADPHWPEMATQQHARSEVARRGEDTVLAAGVGALAVGQVLQGLAGITPITAGRIFTIGLPGYSVEWAEIEVHPKCIIRHESRQRARIGFSPPPRVALPPAPGE